jgi:SAM-dependent methyltransferase
MPFEGEQFDACLAVLMIHQLTSMERSLTMGECRRVLRPNGLMCIKTCSASDLEGRSLNSYFPSALDINRRRYPPIELLRDELTGAGFEAITVEPTETFDEMELERLLWAIEERHNTTLALLPTRELEEGLARIRHDYSASGTIRLRHPHTLLFARRA